MKNAEYGMKNESPLNLLMLVFRFFSLWGAAPPEGGGTGLE